MTDRNERFPEGSGIITAVFIAVVFWGDGLGDDEVGVLNAAASTL
jgi:hypothetical protein